MLQSTHPNNKRDFDKSELDLIDWEKFFKIAISNNLILLVYFCIKNNEQISDDIINRLKQYYYSIIKRNLVFSNELIKIIKLFDTNNIQSLPFKGPVLSYFVYGSIFNRSFADLDILVSEKDLWRAYNLLISFGYSPLLELSEESICQYMVTEHEMPFRKEGIGIVELHWELSSMYLNSQVKFKKIRQYIIDSTYESYDINNLSNEFLIVYLCIHGNKHQWDSIEQVTSISWIIENNKTMDWDKVFRLAKELQCVTMLFVGLNLAKKLYNIELADTIYKYIDNNSKIDYLTNTIIRYVPDDSQLDSISDNKRFTSYHLSIRDSLFDKIRYLLRLLFIPTREDWNIFNLPRRLFLLYWILRPARLAVEFIKAKIL
ncbi:MAG: nucleotidyltransferase family protein [Desulfobacteraceae bacterium]|nr:nucleotidyltransferase family protein [Desulfobacteraceae bacterium]